MKKYILVLSLFTISPLHAKLTESNYLTIFRAISHVESNLNPKAFNEDENAIGVVQIRKLYLIDANYYLNTNYIHDDCYDINISFKVFKAYMKRYRATTYEECARLHNGGPQWRSKIYKTNKFWNKVKKYLN